MIMVSTHLAYINTSDSLLGTKLLYYLSSTFLLAMHTVVHQNALDDASIYIDDALPHAQAKQFLRISLWFYLLFFILFTFIFYKGSNPVSELYITIIHWTLNLKYIGWIISGLIGIIILFMLLTVYEIGEKYFSNDKSESD